MRDTKARSYCQEGYGGVSTICHLYLQMIEIITNIVKDSVDLQMKNFRRPFPL